MKNTLSIFKDISGATYGYRIFSGDTEVLLEGDGYKTVEEITTFFSDLHTTLANLTITVTDNQQE